MPAFYASRIYIDLSDPATYGTGFEELVRWAFDKPLHVRPALGQPPAYIADDSTTVRLGTSSYQKRAIEAIRAGRPNAMAVASEYLNKFLEEMEKFRLNGVGKTDFDEEVFKSIDDFLPYRDEFFEFISVSARYVSSDSIIRIVHRFFEGMIKYMHRPAQPGGYSSWDFDNFRFLAYEMYLGAVAVQIQNERFESAQILIEEDFYVGNVPDLENNGTMGPEVFIHHLQTFEAANQKSNTRKITKVGDVLHERNRPNLVEFRHICAADIILHIRSRTKNKGYIHWYAVTPLYLGHSQSSLELFARSRSQRYFEKVKPLIGMNSADELRSFVEILEKGDNDRFGGGYSRGRSLSSLLNVANLASVP